MRDEDVADDLEKTVFRAEVVVEDDGRVGRRLAASSLKAKEPEDEPELEAEERLCEAERAKHDKDDLGRAPQVYPADFPTDHLAARLTRDDLLASPDAGL
jgi:hypothetical protein